MLFLFPFISAEGQQLSVQSGHPHSIDNLSFDQSNTRLVSQDKSGKVVIWDLKARAQANTFHADDVPHATENFLTRKDKQTVEKGEWKAKVNGPKLMVYFNNRKKYTRSADYFDQGFTSVDFHPEKNLLVAGSQDGTVYVFKLSNGKRLAHLKNHQSDVLDVRISPNGNYFASTGKDRSVILWSGNNLEMEHRLYGTSYRLASVSFSQDGNSLVAGNEIGQVKKIDLASGVPQSILISKHKHGANNVSFLPDHKDSLLVCTADDNKTALYNLQSGKALNKKSYSLTSEQHIPEFIFHNLLGLHRPSFASVHCLAAAPDGSTFAVAGSVKGYNNHKIEVFNAEGKKIKNIPFHSDSVRGLTYLTPHLIASTQGDKRIVFWKLTVLNTTYRIDTLKVPAVFDLRGMEKNKVLFHDKANIYTYDLSIKQLKIIYSTPFITGLWYDSRNKRILCADNKNDLHVLNASGSLSHKLTGHQDRITDASFHPNQSIVASVSHDATVRLWDLDKGKLILTMIPVGEEHVISITPDNYYYAPRGANNKFGFYYNSQLYPPSQFDLQLNRPDIILERLGYANQKLITLYKKAHQKRIRRMGVASDNENLFDMPEIEILNKEDIPASTDADSITLHIKVTAKAGNLQSLHIWINNVPLLKKKGRPIKGKVWSGSVKVPLVKGNNEIHVTAMNMRGIEGLYGYLRVRKKGDPDKVKRNLFIVSIGVSNYAESNFNLKYASKDANDIIEMLKESREFHNVHSLILRDEEVTKNSLKDMRRFLEKAGKEDVAVVFLAGHGVLDADFNYYFGAHNMNFMQPEKGGIGYEEIESLLDGLSVMRKLLLMDTCHSGEIDKEDVEFAQNEDEKEEEITFRSAGGGIREGYGVGSVNAMVKDLFTEVRKGTGATIISSAGGAEYAIEGEKWQNGLFTYALLQGLQRNNADLNRNREITISELQDYVQQKVTNLSGGRQTPTSRIVNRDLDFVVW